MFMMEIRIVVLKYKYFYIFRLRFVHVGVYSDHRIEIELCCALLSV